MDYLFDDLSKRQVIRERRVEIEKHETKNFINLIET